MIFFPIDSSMDYFIYLPIHQNDSFSSANAYNSNRWLCLWLRARDEERKTKASLLGLD